MKVLYEYAKRDNIRLSGENCGTVAEAMEEMFGKK